MCGVFLSLLAGFSAWASANSKSVVCFKSQPYVAFRGEELYSALGSLQASCTLLGGLWGPVPTCYLDDLPRSVSG